MKVKIKYTIVQFFAFLICIIPPTVATLYQFPNWIKTSSACTVSGIALLMLIFCAVPLFKFVKKHLDTVSAPVMWYIVLVLSILLKSIIEQVVFISAIGAISNTVGFVILRYEKRKTEKE